MEMAPWLDKLGLPQTQKHTFQEVAWHGGRSTDPEIRTGTWVLAWTLPVTPGPRASHSPGLKQGTIALPAVTSVVPQLPYDMCGHEKQQWRLQGK